MGQEQSQENFIRDDIIQKPISEFTRYHNYIKEQITENLKSNNLKSNNNINGLKCEINKDTNIITYKDSEFNNFELIIKSFYKYFIGAYTTNISFTKVFKNSEDKDASGLFLDYSIVFDAYLYTKFKEILKSKEKNNLNTKDKDKKIEDELKISKSLFEKKQDTEIIDPEHMFIKKNIDPDPQLLSNYTQIMKDVNSGKSVCMLSFVKNNNLIHSIAIIFWKDDTDQINCGLYDPIYYERQNKIFTWAVNTLYITLTLLSKKYASEPNNPTNHSLNIINLSLFCLKNKEGGIHCPQYIIDAEYCSMYCMYFLFLYGQQNFPKDLNSIKTIIKNTFIVEPEKLKRNPCRDTNIFRIVMINFILSILIIITKNLTILKKINTINTKYFEKYNYNLITDDLLEYLQAPIKAQALINEAKNIAAKEERAKIILLREEANKKAALKEHSNHQSTNPSISVGGYKNNKTNNKIKNKTKIKTKTKNKNNSKLKNKTKTYKL